MKAHLKTLGGRLVVELESDSVKGLFKEIAAAQEILDVSSCGTCGQTDIKFNVRTVDSFTYYEAKCQNCHAAFSFGQLRDGSGLFPKYKDADGNWLPNGGWVKYHNQAGNA